MTRASVTKGTAKEISEIANGYSANGESEHSRRSAHSQVTLPSHVAKKSGQHSLGELIVYQISELARLRGRIIAETDQTKLGKLHKNLSIKQKFVERLVAQKNELDKARMHDDATSGRLY